MCGRSFRLNPFQTMDFFEIQVHIKITETVSPLMFIVDYRNNSTFPL